MSSRRHTALCRLLLAIGLLAAPAAVAAWAAAPAAASRPVGHHLPVKAHVHAVGALSPTTRTAGAEPGAAHRMTSPVPVLAAVALGLALFAVGLAGRRRVKRLVGAVRAIRSARGPPNRTSGLVPNGYPPGSAGRLSRSHRALYARTIPVHC
jgi:hypothetical protein